MNSKIEYAYIDGLHVIKMRGEIRYSDVTSLHSFIESIKDNQSSYIMDLSQTQLLDSTALGILAAIANHCRNEGLETPIIYVSSRNVREILLGVCFDQVFEIKEHLDDKFFEQDHFNSLIKEQLELTELKETVRQAHENLAQVSEKNSAIFRDVNDIINNVN